MPETKITRRDFPLVFERQTTEVHKIVVTRFQGYILEMEDFHFHFDSAVMLPDYDIAEGAADRITALTVLATGLSHARKYPTRKTMVAGHTDTSGAADYNVQLSKQRAECVLASWTGDKAAFTNICLSKSKVEDYQQILKWAFQSKAYPCDPGLIDNVHGNGTSTALKNFKTAYNAEFSRSLPITGTCDKATWEAFFDLYNQAIAQFLSTDVEGLAAYRAALKWVDPGRKTVGCGENWPVDGIGVDNYRSATNRRVEILFFDPGQEPLLECHPSPTQCKPTECELYWTKCFKHAPIPVKPGPVPLTDELLDIVTCDDHFAPSAETLDIAYKLKNLEGKPVTLEISSAHPDAKGIVFTKDLPDPEKTTGDHTFKWDGKPSVGPLKDLFIHPLWSPYTVTLKSGGLSDKAEFKVLYHSLELRKGPWTHDEKEPAEPDKNNWVAFKLNELGYYGGPVFHDTDNYLKKAIIRYKAAHKSMHQKFIKKYTDSIDATLIAALKAGDNPRKGVEPAAITDPTAESKIWLEALTYERTTGTKTEFGNVNRATTDAARLNRPLQPLEVEIFLKSKADAKTAAPEAIGPVRVNWKYTDANCTLDNLPADVAASPSKTKAYVEKSLKLKAGRTGKGDNCPTSAGGLRDPNSDFKTTFFSGTLYEPHKVENDNGNKTVFVKACVDKAKYPKRLGRSGILFRPSLMAGDDYKLKAEMDFTGEPNKADLEKFHGFSDEASRFHQETGTFTLWRQNHVAKSIEWPARTVDYQWDLIRGEYLAAFMDLDVANIDSVKMTAVMTQDQFRDIVTANTAHKTRANIPFRDDCVYGIPLPAQTAGEKASDYRARIKLLVGDNFWDLIYDPLTEKIGELIRPATPTGYISLNFLSHPPLVVNKTDGTLSDGSYITWTTSVGQPDTTVLIDQKDVDKIYYVVGHEMGHSLYLLHASNTPDKNPNDHDKSDNNCFMSYSSNSSGFAFQAQGDYEPHLCGRCNLKVRGWNITALPANS